MADRGVKEIISGMTDGWMAKEKTKNGADRWMDMQGRDRVTQMFKGWIDDE